MTINNIIVILKSKHFRMAYSSSSLLLYMETLCFNTEWTLSIVIINQQIIINWWLINIRNSCSVEPWQCYSIVYIWSRHFSKLKTLNCDRYFCLKVQVKEWYVFIKEFILNVQAELSKNKCIGKKIEVWQRGVDTS